MLHHSHPFSKGPDRPFNPQLGDVVLFRFPVSDRFDSFDTPKRRPCLVLDTFHQGMDRFVELAYGTSSWSRANWGFELIVRQAESQVATGLSKPTRFICARRIAVHINSRGFDCPSEEASPVIGHLDETLMDRLLTLQARIQGESGVTKHRREKQQAEQGR